VTSFLALSGTVCKEVSKLKHVRWALGDHRPPPRLVWIQVRHLRVYWCGLPWFLCLREMCQIVGKCFVPSLLNSAEESLETVLWSISMSVCHFLHHHCHHSLLLLFSTPGSILHNSFLRSSSTFPPTRLTPRTPAVYRFSGACRF